MSDWDFPLVDYWDQTTGAINRSVLRLIDLSAPERIAACGQIRDAVLRRLQGLSDRQVLQAVVSMVDDLYKYVNNAVVLDQALFAYLDAFARTLIKTAAERGYVLRYVVENQFADVDFLMRGPLHLFPKVFNAAGCVYVCPHHLAWQLMQADGVAAPAYAEASAQYIDEARVVGDRLVSQCQEIGRPYVFLEADYQDGALAMALQGSDMPGVLAVFRNEPPAPGSTVSVRFPDQKRTS